MIIFKKILFAFFCITITTSGLAAQNEGIASYYGDAFHGSKTANGEVYDRNKLTGAHKTFPFGTYVEVTRTDNGKSVIIKINDRGPFISGRVIDVSQKAAEKLGLIRDGVAPVKLKKVNGPQAETTKAPAVAKEKPAPKTETATTKAPVEKPVKKAAPTKKEKPTPSVSATKSSKPAPPAESSSEIKTVTSETYKNYDLYKIQVLRPTKEGFGVQVASLTSYENVLKRIAELQGKYFKNILTSVEKGKNGKPVYKIIMGPFPTQEKATAYKKSLAKKHKIKGFLVNLGEIAY